MGWKLAPGVGYCRVADDIVFLDLRRDRYFRLGDHDRLAFEALEAGTGDHPEGVARIEAAALVRAGGCDDRPVPAFAEIPQRDIFDLPPARASVAGVVAATASLLWARRAAASARIFGTVGTIERRKAGLRPTPTPAQGDMDAASLALRYEACRPFAPVARRCLLDSLALMRLCLGHGIAPALVFGVRTEPFMAHCWLQHGERILTCASDDALGFTPILVA